MRIERRKKLACALASTFALFAGTAQAGIGFRAGDWDLDFSGNVNGFATWNSCDNKDFNIAGGLACNKGPGGTNVQSIESGLLPSALVFSAKSRQLNLDIGVTVGLSSLGMRLAADLDLVRVASSDEVGSSAFDVDQVTGIRP